jgi:hypothetical protein
VIVDGKETKKLSLPKNKKEIEEEISEENEEEEEENEEEDPTFEIEDYDSGSNSGSQSEEDILESEEDVASAIKKTGKKEVKSERKKGRKRKADKSIVKEAKKIKKEKKKTPKIQAIEELDEDEDETKEKPASNIVAEKKDGGEKKAGGKPKKELPNYSDKNLDVDLFKTSAANLNQRRMRVAANVIMTCKMIDEIDGKPISYEYAALTFQRRMANGKMFEFMLPLTSLHAIRKGLDYIEKENPKFFDKD